MLVIYKQMKKTMVLSKLGAGLIIAILMLPIATNAQTENTTPIKLETKESVDLSKDVEISADELEANLRKDIVVFVGNVAISQKDLLLTADRVTVFYQTEENTKSSINRIDASGSVHLTTKTEAIDSTWGIYDFTDKIITLGGKVILKRSDGEVTGKKLIYNLDSGLITIEGSAKNNNRVKGQFTLPEKK